MPGASDFGPVPRAESVNWVDVKSSLLGKAR